MKRLATFLSVIAVLAVLASAAPVICVSASARSLPSPVVAQTAQQQVCAGIGLAGGNCGGSGAGQVTKVVDFVINLISLIVGVAATIMIIFAGMKFITSGGDPSKVSSAKNSVIYALIGLVVVAASQLMVHFIINKAG
jgi:uncharacterized membrane protein